MDINCRAQNIKAIIKLEGRIGLCNRCPALLKCTSKPSLGKGDLEPEAMVIFECESTHTQDINWVVELRESIQKYFNINSVYHTFLVRCQPKACTRGQDISCTLNGKVLDRNNICLFTNQPCDGIPVKPSNEEVINCLYFLLEEIEVLKPKYVFLFGSRVSDFVLKTYGVFESRPGQQLFEHETATFISMVEEEAYSNKDFKKVATLINKH